jgi:putative addiction module component (TIGR02574 family)
MGKWSNASKGGAMAVGLNELTSRALSLPIEERVKLAQALWESLEEGGAAMDAEGEAEALALARKRDAELSAGEVQGAEHDEVMEKGRRALECGSSITRTPKRK